MTGQYTQGSKTFQYLEEKKTTRFSNRPAVVADDLNVSNSPSSGERKGNSPNLLFYFLKQGGL